MPPTTKEKEGLLNPFPIKYRIAVILFHISQILLVLVYALITILSAVFINKNFWFLVEATIPFYVQISELFIVSLLSIAMCLLLCVPSVPPRVYLMAYLIYSIACAVFFFLGGVEYPIALLVFIGDMAYRDTRYNVFYLYAQFFFACLMTFHLNVMPFFVATGVRRLLHIRTGVVKG